MTLGEMENTILAELQQPGVDFTSAAPNWGSLNIPNISQALVDAFINQGYKKLIEDTADIELALVQVSFPSVALPAAPATGNTTGWLYPIVPVANPVYPACYMVAQIGYAPQGLVYTQWYERGIDFVSHQDFMEASGYGYMQAFSSATLPSKVAVDDTRQNIELYPAAAQAGDTIFVKYVPIPTAAAQLCPTLVAAADKPIVPDGSAHDAIVSFALSRLWLRLRNSSMAMQEMQKYRLFLRELKQNFRRTSNASNMRVRTSSFDQIGIGDDL